MRKLITFGITLVAGSTYLARDYLVNDDKLKASWTNTYEPSVKWDHNWDRRDPISIVKHHKNRTHSAELKDFAKQLQQAKESDQQQQQVPTKTVDDFDINKHSSKARRHLFLIRHGQYNMKTKEANEMILTELGREQADLTGRRLKDLMSKFKFTKLIHSDVVRAIETANIIRTHLPQDLPVSVDPLLAEGAPIPPEPPVGHWRPEFHQFFQDGGRIEAAFRKHFYRAPPEQLEDSYEIIVCHANVIRYLFCRALQFPAEAWLRFDLQHGSITHIVISPDGRVGCKALGDAGFMPSAKNTSS